MRRLRDDPQCADEEFAALTAEADPGLHRGAELRSAGRHRRTLRCARHAPGGGDPARAGRQQPGRDGGRVRARRLRAARRAHDGPAERAPHARASSRAWWPAAASPTATCSAPGEGWAKSILFHEAVREEFERFFARSDTFTLGICNGCQMFAALKSIIPGTAHWPRFVTQPQRAVRGALLAGARCCRRPRCCSQAWPAPSCRLRWHMARAAQSSPPRRRRPRVRRVAL